jgi:hypothetical protein
LGDFYHKTSGHTDFNAETSERFIVNAIKTERPRDCKIVGSNRKIFDCFESDVNRRWKANVNPAQFVAFHFRREKSILNNSCLHNGA